MKSQVLLGLALGLVGAAGLLSQATEALRVRSDGVYYWLAGGTATKPTFQYFRFYKDGTALTVYSSAKPAQVAAWLNQSNENVSEGKWTLEGDSLTVKIGSETRYTTYTGSLTADAWILSAAGTKPTKFAFAKVVFAPEKAQAGPRIEQEAKTTNTFSYDDAGRTIGVTTTIEVAATDPSGSPLTFDCTTSSGTIKTQGSKCIWERPIEMGEPGHGVVTVVVSNSKGARASRRFAF